MECRLTFGPLQAHPSRSASHEPLHLRPGMPNPLSLCFLLVAASLSLFVHPAPGASFESVTFAAEPGRVYVPLQAAAARLRLRVDDSRNGTLTRLNGAALEPGAVRLVNSLPYIHLDALGAAGAAVSRDPLSNRCLVQMGKRRFSTTPGPKRVEVNLALQRLYAYQGDTLVLETNISSGRYGNTPSGTFSAGPYKSRMHYSSRYHNAPMPWSVQITGHIFFHGFSSVPSYPASHGCIRVPLTGINPARFLYEWIDVGTPIRIDRGQREEIRRALPAS